VIDLLWAPFLACLVLTAMHVYLGLHVLARGVVFVDLALAQIAALGITVAFLAGHPIQSPAAYWYALAFALGGAALFSGAPLHRAPIPQEAVIGIVYALSAAVAVLAVDRAPQGGEHVKQILVGSILAVTPGDVAMLAVGYGAIGILHAALRRPLLEISLEPAAAAAKGRRIAWWDLCFYSTFALVVTSSVRLAGVLLVFAYLIVPAAVAALLARRVAVRLAIAWAVGVIGSALGLAASFALDLPTGATVVAALGLVLTLIALALGARGLIRRARAEGWRGMRGLGVALAAALSLAGLLLTLFPRMDHHWLDGLEAVAPGVELAFLSRGERAAFRESREGMIRGTAELARARALQQDVQWGARQMSEEGQERLRQYVAGRAEIAAGDRMVLATLRGRARERQRFALGLPMLALGAGGLYLLARGRGRGAASPPRAIGS